MVEIQLAEILDSQGAVRLATELCCVRGHAATLDASQVRVLSASCLQVLISARKTWALDAKPWRIENIPRPLGEVLALYGVDELIQPLQPPAT
jgi:chemotaxis protein CheX